MLILSLFILWRLSSVVFQHIEEHTSDFGSTLDLIFANCQSFCDVIEAYWSDHKLIYCALETQNFFRFIILSCRLLVSKDYILKSLYENIAFMLTILPRKEEA